MKNYLLFILLLTGFYSFAQQKYTISGTISEEESAETLIGVNVLIPEIQSGAITNEYGFYSITIPEGTYEVHFTSIGFTSKSETIILSENKVINLSLASAFKNSFFKRHI